MARARLTDEQRAQQRKEAFDRLENATQQLLTSDGWRGWLRTRSTLHGYSVNNQLLLWAQAVERDMALDTVAGFRAWTRLGRCVRKGERGLRIISPRPLRRKQDDDEERDAKTERVNDDRPPITFGIATVFDVSQTDPLPGVEPTPLQPPSQPISGDSHAHLIDAFTDAGVLRGFTVSYVEDLAFLGQPVDGLANKSTGLIQLRAGMAPNRTVSVLIHELAHQLIGMADLPRDFEEVAVESATYVVTAAAGLDCSSEAVPYIAGWAGIEDPIAVVKVAARAIDQVAAELQTVLEDGGDDPEPVENIANSAESDEAAPRAIAA